MKQFVLVVAKIWLACSRLAGDVDLVTDRKALPWAELQVSQEFFNTCNRLCHTTAQHVFLLDITCCMKDRTDRVIACIAARLPTPCYLTICHSHMSLS